MYDPIELGKITEKVICRDSLRKYYRFRGGMFYGGIATADCVGCNLSCAFCWSRAPRKHPEIVGHFYTPQQVFEKLVKIASARGYSKLRISGNEPTLSKSHLLRLLELVNETDYLFILETNGLLLGADETYTEELAGFKNLHVRVSLKGCDEAQFSQLTGAIPEAFELQLRSLENLIKAGVDCHPAIMKEFTNETKLSKLRGRLERIDPKLAAELEFEILICFPHVIQELKKIGIEVMRKNAEWTKMNY